VKVTVGTVSHDAKAGADGKWSVAFAGAELPADGTHLVTAVATDKAGNASAPSAGTPMVVDTKVGITETDAVMARKLHGASVPVILVANKFDSDMQYADMAEFYALGLGDPWPVSAQHGRGGADVLDEILSPENLLRPHFRDLKVYSGSDPSTPPAVPTALEPGK